MANRQELQERIQAFARELAEEFGEVEQGEALSWLDAVESQAVEVGDAVATELVKHKAAQLESPQQQANCPGCGQAGRYRGLRERPLVTRRGETAIQEPEYYCPCCRKAFFPDDESHRR